MTVLVVATRRFQLVAASVAVVLLVVATAVAALGHLARAAAAGAGAKSLDHHRRPQRQAAARLCDGRRPLAAAGRCETAVDPGYLKLLLAYEDRRFRVAWRRRSAGARARGASARHPRPHRLRRLDHHDAAGAADGAAARALGLAKLRQMVRAVQIERRLSKDEILDLYLALAPFGGNLEGIRAASHRLFRQGAEAADACGSSAAGRAAAIAGTPPARSLSAKPRTPRATACSTASVEDGVVSQDGCGAGEGGGGAAAAQADADPGAAFRRCRRWRR